MSDSTAHDVYDALDHDPAMERKREVARAFGEAAESYDHYAVLQRRVADDLAQKIIAKEVGLPYLEIGCGTGFLGAALEERLAGMPCLFTDISPPMVDKCRERLSASSGGLFKDAGFAVMDGEVPGVTEQYGLIAASLVFQWFDDLPAAIARLAGYLAPGGRLAFAMLGAGSLGEWRVACGDHGLESGVPCFPTAQELDGMWPTAIPGGSGRVESTRIVRHHLSARNFLHELKAIGARVPDPDHVPQGPGGMRALLREIDGESGGENRGDGFSVTYHVLYGFFTRDKGSGGDGDGEL